MIDKLAEFLMKAPVWIVWLTIFAITVVLWGFFVLLFI